MTSFKVHRFVNVEFDKYECAHGCGTTFWLQPELWEDVCEEQSWDVLKGNASIYREATSRSCVPITGKDK